MQASGKPWQHYANVLVKIAFIAVFVYGGFALTERFHFGWIEQLIFWPVLAIVGYWLVIREVAPVLFARDLAAVQSGVVHLHQDPGISRSSGPRLQI